MPTERPASWTPAHSALLQLLDAAIETARTTARPTVDLTALRRVRRDLVRMDNGHQPYPDSPLEWSPHAAYRLIRQVITAAPLGHSAAGTVLRLAADIADQNAAARAAATATKKR
ncbi:hypothetical protein V2S66_16930 [Streptomyces sp. V4-01]|uniref:Uncharacterized protein n=1 Tax=Actinacidiphila polyblastidii TaxID=3110430 RepID=A0ABU7PED5_9ACTN|nr:hypothetical protein [Streptomyces sp. V4-01]